MNAMRTQKNLYDFLIYDSKNEQEFAEHLDVDDQIAVYVKLPKGFYIPTPVGNYNPDWAIAFKQGTVKHIYFVAETKGSLSTLELRPIEKFKIDCAGKHFQTISNGQVVYKFVDSYAKLMTEVMQ